MVTMIKTSTKIAIALFLLLVLMQVASAAFGQVIGLQPTPQALYTWNPTTNVYDQVTTTDTANPFPNTPQAFVWTRWNPSLGQWVPCQTGETCGANGGAITWPPAGDIVVSNGTNSPAGLAPANGDCPVGAGGVWTVGTCGTPLSIQYDSTPVADQSTLNFLDNGTIAPDAGYSQVIFKTNSSGGLAAEYIAGQQFQGQLPPLPSGQAVIVYPTGVSTNIASGCTSDSTAQATNTSAYLTSGCGFGIPAVQADWTFTGALPSYINPANVTAVYGISTNGVYQTNAAFYNLQCAIGGSTATLNPGGNHWPIQPFGAQIAGATGAGVDTATCTASLSNTTGAYSPPTIMNVASMALYVYYTGTAPPADNALNLGGLLYYNPSLNLISTGPTNLASNTDGGVIGLLPNANLANPSMTISGTVCTLGGSCSPSGSGSVTDGSGTTTAGQIAVSTATLHQIQYLTALPNGTTATTQTTGDTSTDVATDAFVANAIAGGGCPSALTMNASGAGASPGTTYNCATAQTISYNTIGAAAAPINGAIYTACTNPSASTSGSMMVMQITATCALTLPTGATAYNWVIQNASSQTLTVAPPSGTITVGAFTTSSLSIPAGSSVFIEWAGSTYISTAPLVASSTVALTPGATGIVVSATGGGGSVTWPAANDIVVSNSSNSPAGLAPVNGDCVVGASGAWTAGTCTSTTLEPTPFAWTVYQTGTLALSGGSGGSGYSGTGTCTLTGGVISSGTADTCSVSESGGVISYSLSGSAVYYSSPTLSFTGFIGGTGAVVPVVQISSPTVVAIDNQTQTVAASGSDIATVMNTVMNANAQIGGTFYIKPSTYNLSACTQETVSPYTSLYYLIGIPSANSGSSYPAWHFIGETESASDSMLPPSLAGVVMNVTTAAETCAGSGNTLDAFWSRPNTAKSTVYNLYYSGHVSVDNVVVTFPSISRGNERAFDFLEALYLEASNDGAAFVTAPITNGPVTDIAFNSPGNFNDGCILSNDYVIAGWGVGFGVNGEHCYLLNDIATQDVYGIYLGLMQNRDGDQIQNGNLFDHFEADFDTYGLYVSTTNVALSIEQLDVLNFNWGTGPCPSGFTCTTPWVGNGVLGFFTGDTNVPFLQNGSSQSGMVGSALGQFYVPQAASIGGPPCTINVEGQFAPATSTNCLYGESGGNPLIRSPLTVNGETIINCTGISPCLLVNDNYAFGSAAELCNTGTSGVCWSIVSEGNGSGVLAGALYFNNLSTNVVPFTVLGNSSSTSTALLLAGGEFAFSPATAIPTSNAQNAGWSSPTSGEMCADSTTRGNCAGQIKVASVVPGVTYSAAGTPLPTCASGIAGTQATVSDATNTSGAYVSGGTNLGPVACTYNGSSYSWQMLSTAASSSVGGTVTYTSSQTASSSDNGKQVRMNCSSACAYTLPATQPSTTWNIASITSVGSTLATIALGGSDTYNSFAAPPVLQPWKPYGPLYANSATSTDYEGPLPLIPPVLPNLIYWFSADRGPAQTGTAVTPVTWNDPADSITAASTSTNIPVWSSACQNGQPCYTFSTSSSEFIINNPEAVFDQPITIFAVFKTPASFSATTNYFLFGGNGVQFGFDITTTSGSVAHLSINNGSAGIATDTTVLSANTWYQATMTYNYSTQAYQFWVNETSSSSGTGTAQSVSSATSTIGQNCGCSIADEVVYGRILSSTEINAMQQTLKAIYGT